MSIPTVRFNLRQLMIDKYGEGKFDVACEIVARWLSPNEYRYQWKASEITMLCSERDGDRLSYQWLILSDLQKLKELFHLKTVEEIYTTK
jgi:hypothetical protein